MDVQLFNILIYRLSRRLVLFKLQLYTLRSSRFLLRNSISPASRPIPPTSAVSIRFSLGSWAAELSLESRRFFFLSFILPALIFLKFEG